VIAIDDFTRLWAHQLLIDPVLADHPAWGAVRCNATVVDLAGSEPGSATVRMPPQRAVL
jgi:hypothetical protein